MYGLYRAWFGGGTTGTSYPCLQDTFSPPDTVVRVGNEGEHQFVAHKGVLAAHSGYLKALLASAAATTTSSNFDPTCATVAVTATNGQSQRPVTSVSVSSIGGEAFAPLLNYMYTGRLEVTLDNVYSVLLATHLLHMPGALEQCRAALLRLRAPPSLPTPPMPTSASTTGSPPGTTGSILRPIPSRLIVGPPLCWPPTTPLAYPPAAPAPTAMSHLPPSIQPLMQPTVPPGISIVGPREKQEQCAHYSAGEMSKSPQSSPTAARKRPRLHSSRSRTPEIVSTVSTLPFVAAAAAAFTAFAVTSSTPSSTTRAPSPSRSISPALSSVSRTHSPMHHNSDRSTEREAQRGEEIEDRSGRSSNDQLNKSRTAASDSRVPNRNRGNSSNDSNDNGDTASEHDRARSSRRRARMSSAKEASTTSSTVFSVVYDIACCDGPVRFHRVLNENYSSTTSHGPHGASTRPLRNCQLTEGEDLSSENDENGGPATRGGGAGGSHARSPSNDSSNDGSNNGGCYTCGYCKHTFKSQYCYRKHAKRHLLPTRINETVGGGGGGGGGAGDSVNHGPRQDAARGGRREVRLLDLNVQYYPCKICGCKFPSYYFVHKHRKLCHANDEERQGATDGAANASSRDADVSPIQDVP
ncbi:PREDICTED: proline-rich protein 36 [Wasmannia auropunctata]|uniref:proline-rich protein 36 n=1 Tax=Wasmannia auropunctata TaxID=64793 RepID=UPI0005ED56CD|nr:PREDICTED: proline-rich protein 36 [Wasmannia auropunctata]